MVNPDSWGIVVATHGVSLRVGRSKSQKSPFRMGGVRVASFVSPRMSRSCLLSVNLSIWNAGKAFVDMDAAKALEVAILALKSASIMVNLARCHAAHPLCSSRLRRNSIDLEFIAKGRLLDLVRGPNNQRASNRFFATDCVSGIRAGDVIEQWVST